MKRIILLAFLCTTTLVMAQRINHVQEAIANYDYEAALTLIAKEKPTYSCKKVKHNGDLG
jgi:hypothetical protein